MGSEEWEIPQGASTGNGTSTRDTDAGATPSGPIQGPGESATPNGGGATARGVSATSIKLGIACPDFSAFELVNPAYGSGDCERQWAAALAVARENGRLPVHGRDIELVFRSYNVLSPEETRAACVGLLQDEQVFAVLDQFGSDVACVTGEFAAPLINGNQTTDELGASSPLFFSPPPTMNRVVRNMPSWMIERGVVQGRRIGIYWSNFNEVQYEVSREILPEMERLGLSNQIVAEVTNSESGSAGPTDTIAVQRFRSARVDLVISFTTAISMTNFMQQAEAQNYRPAYVFSDFVGSSSDTAGSTYPPEQAAGMLALTGFNYGMSNQTDPPKVAPCIDAYRATGQKPGRNSAPWSFTLIACDLLDLFLVGVEGAGAQLTNSSFVAAMERVEDYPLTNTPSATFSADRHVGGDLQKTLEWDTDCDCYLTVTSFGPFWVR